MLILAFIGVVLLAGYLVVAGAIVALLVSAWTGSHAPMQHLPSAFWRDLAMWAVVQGMSMIGAFAVAFAVIAVVRAVRPDVLE